MLSIQELKVDGDMLVFTAKEWRRLWAVGWPKFIVPISFLGQSRPISLTASRNR